MKMVFAFQKVQPSMFTFFQQWRLHTDPVLKLYKVIIPVVPQS